MSVRHLQGQGLDGGLNALSLVQASGERGLPLRSYRMDLQGLQTYFARGGLPVILHVTRPELHWVVGVVLAEGFSARGLSWVISVSVAVYRSVRRRHPPSPLRAPSGPRPRSPYPW